ALLAQRNGPAPERRQSPDVNTDQRIRASQPSAHVPIHTRSPSVDSVTAPSRSVRKSRTPAWAKRSTTSGCGWPNRLWSPTGPPDEPPRHARGGGAQDPRGATRPAAVVGALQREAPRRVQHRLALRLHVAREQERDLAVPERDHDRVVVARAPRRPRWRPRT